MSILKKLIVAVLTLQARAVLRKYKPRIIAVTGSVGKTSAKDAIYAVLANSAQPSTGLGVRVRKSDKSFNSEIGLPLTILGVPNAWKNPFRWVVNILDGIALLFGNVRYPEWLVLEVGADRPGDIRKVAEWLPVDMAVITRLPEVPVHVEYFDSPDDVVAEKAALISALRPGGTLVLFADDERFASLAARAPGPVVTFGFSELAQVRGGKTSLILDDEDYPEGVEADITHGTDRAHVKVLGAAGDHALLPMVAAAAVGVALGLSLPECAKALEHYEAPPGRMRLLRGIKDSLIIDDTYNSSPAALLAALDTLALFPKRGRRIADNVGGAAQERGIPLGRRIAVLGDMSELGRHSMGEHKKIGARAAEVVDILYTVGFRARGIAEGALTASLHESKIFQFEDAEKAGDALNDELKEGDAVLVKGSQMMRMERTVESLMADPRRASELLVRQEEEWKKR